MGMCKEVNLEAESEDDKIVHSVPLHHSMVQERHFATWQIISYHQRVIHRYCHGRIDCPMTILVKELMFLFIASIDQ
jgi:hypothetical protein